MEEKPFDELSPEGLKWGRCTWAARYRQNIVISPTLGGIFYGYPDRAIFVLDSSRSITDSILYLILQEPREAKERLVKRLVYNKIGNPEWVMPLPEFSPEYCQYEDQVRGCQEPTKVG